MKRAPAIARILVGCLGAAVLGTTGATGATSAAAPSAPVAPASPDPRLRMVSYDPAAVVTVPVKRGTVTLIVLGADEAIAQVASGIGADCTKPEASWCVAAQPGGRTIFVKPKTAASGANNLAVVTDRRIHSFRLAVLEDRDPRAPLYRLVVNAPAPSSSAAMAPATSSSALRAVPWPPLPAPPPPAQVVAERLQATPRVMNTQYSLAEGAKSEDIVPTLVFDDGRFTYLRFPGNREVPAVFHVLQDGSETLVNTRMEADLLVVDRVSRHLMLRAGHAVVGLWNDGFELDGTPPEQGTTVAGVQRMLKAAPAGSPALPGGAKP
ncbi:TrbG/VirB9 family P-type conjugative transfer protein [Roseateles sp.]|uniref:TrbG/VirB9 family P-type conjugative transfer protein n=1 Tax=Roseateles sp. TaxID=1971397 RepID=UPI0039EC8824